MELIYYSTATNSAGYRIVDGVQLEGTDLIYRGENKEEYRYHYILKNHHDQDDYSRFIPFLKVMSLPNGPTLQAQASQALDVDEWMRGFALVSLLGEGDFYTFSNPHNLFIYCRPEDNRMVALFWDVEQLFMQSSGNPLNGRGYWSDIADLPGNLRRLYAHALDLFDYPYNTNYMAYWTAHYSQFAPGQDYSDLLEYMTERTTAVLAEIEAAGGNAAFTCGDTNYLVTPGNLVTLSGTAPVQVQTLLVNGIAYPIIWTSVSNWSLTIPLNQATNQLSVTALNLQGNLLTNYSADLTVEFTGQMPNSAETVVINEIYYNPQAPNSAFVEIYNSSTNTSFDLSNWQLNGVGYVFPPGSMITNEQHLVLAQDLSGFVAAFGAARVPFGVFPGTLQPDGERLSLIIPGAGANQEVLVNRVRYSPAPPWPATPPGLSLQLVDPARDNFRVGNWQAALATPAEPNAVQASIPAFPPLWINEVQASNITGPTNSAGQRTAWLELYNPGATNVSLAGLHLTHSYTDLAAWTFPAEATVAAGEFKLIFADGLTNLSTAAEPHTAFVLTNGAGSLALSRLHSGQPQVIDFIDYTNLPANRSFGSIPDGQSFDRMEFFYLTPGSTNNGASAPLAVTINEWMAANTRSLTNPVSGRFSDWFELHNFGTNAVSLAGYYLTDTLTNKFKFRIPFGYSIPAGGFLVVFADERNTNGTPELHATFKMSKAGESLGLFGADGSPVDFVNYGPQTDDVSQGRYRDSGPNLYFMPQATPGASNMIPNSAPLLASIADRIIHIGQTLQFTASATDLQTPPQTLAYSLDPVGPPDATVSVEAGTFHWTATNVAAPSTNVFSLRVSDNGNPALSDSKSFSVVVVPPPELAMPSLNGSMLTLAFATLPGQIYQVECKDELTDPTWIPLTLPIPGDGTVIQVEDIVVLRPQRYYRLQVGP